MTQSTALTTTNGTGGVVARSTMSATHGLTPAPVSARTIEAILRPAGGVADPITSGPLAGYSRSMVDTVKGSVAKGAPDEQLFMFLTLCIRHNLDPFARDAWCINMAGPNQTPQWMVAPSRDGYLKAARRHPNVKSVTSGVVHDGDDYAIDKVNGHVKHMVAGMKAKPGPILGAWCLVVMHDGNRYADDVYLVDVKRSSPVWNNFEAQMVEKCAQSKVLKKTVGMSDLYISDKVWQSIDADEAGALLVDPTTCDYVDGFAIGPTPMIAASAPAFIDNGITDVPVPANNPPVNDAEYQHQKALDDLGTVITAARKRIGAPAKETPANVKAMVSDMYGVADVRNLTTDQITELSQRLTDTPTLLVQRPVADPVAIAADDDEIPPFDAPTTEIGPDEAARIAERERAEAATND